MRLLAVIAFICLSGLSETTWSRQAAPGSSDVAIWKADLQFLATQLPKLHVNPFSTISERAFLQRIERATSRIGGMRDDERFVELSRIVAAIGDAHTGIAYRPKAALPLMLYRFRDGLFITNVTEDRKDVLDGQILAVDGRPYAEIERAIAEMVPHENEAQVWKSIPNYLTSLEILHGLGVVSAADRATLTVKKSNGETVQVSLAPLSMTSRPAWAVPVNDTANLPLYRRNQDKFYWYQYLPDSKTFYFKYNSCRQMKDRSFESVVGEVLQGIDQTPGARLVVDLRNNGGGDSGIFEPLLSGLKARPAFRQKGALFVVIGRQTFSSAVLNAVELKRDTAAVFVGEPTGGKPNHFGEVRTVKLPGTGLDLSYSTKYFKESSVDTPSLDPDLRVDLTIADLRAKRDPVMAAILATKTGARQP